MSFFKKCAIVTLVIAAVSQCSAPEAKADPFSKFFAKAGRKVVGGTYKSVSKNVSKSSSLILKTAPYALLQGSSSRSSRPSTSSNTFQSFGKAKATTGKATGSWKQTVPSKFRGVSKGTFKKPVNFGPRFRR